MKNNDNYDIDKKIKEYLVSESNNIHASDNMFFKVRNEILSRNERGFLNMKIGFLKVKTALIAAALCIATTASVGAATNGLSWFGSNGFYKDITTYPTEDKVKDTVGFTPKYVESFDNGFKFKSSNYRNEELRGDTGNTIRKQKSADFYYTKDGSSDNQDININAEKISEEYFNSNETKEMAEMTEYNGVKIYYRSYKYKAVPDGYTPTDEENAKIDKGELQIGYGDPDSEIIEKDTQYVFWYEDGIGYSILNMDYDDITQEEMINMAKTIIDK